MHAAAGTAKFDPAAGELYCKLRLVGFKKLAPPPQVRLMAKEHLGRYRNTWDCLGQVLRQEGPTVRLEDI